jgi:hypothetical protein
MPMPRKFLVVPRLPHAGLGNMLLVWARAVVFAELNQLPIRQPNWQLPHIGPWLRRERCKRYYGSFFTSHHYKSGLRSFAGGVAYQKYFHHNPLIEKIDLNTAQYAMNGKHSFVFDEMPPWQDYFQDLKQYQSLIKQKFFADIRPQLLKQILSRPRPAIALHIRRGDYGSPEGVNDFATQRIVYTPLEWYVSTLSSLRQTLGYDIPATIFSDGRADELGDILRLPNVNLSPEASALSDLITMSRSKLLVASCHSSFSGWASYLSQSPTLWDSNRASLYEAILPDPIGLEIYNGGFDPLDPSIPSLLRQNLDQIFLNRVCSC